MDNLLFSEIEKLTPKLNPILAKGYACHQLDPEIYIDRVIRCAAASFPPGLLYHGYSYCTPKEELEQSTHRKNSKAFLEISKSDIYLMKFKYEYLGEVFYHYLYMPFISEAGLITIKNARFQVSPVLADTALSVGSDSIFLPMNKDKVTFFRFLYGFMEDGQRRSEYVVYSTLYHGATKKKSTKILSQPQTTLMHYLLCKRGLSTTFGQYGNAIVEVGYEDTINTTNYPIDQWVICESTGIRPQSIKNPNYIPTRIKLAIRREHYNLTIASMVAGFFYVVDLFPDRCTPEDMNDIQFWRIRLGQIFFNNESEIRLLNTMDIHMKSLDSYVDGMVREWLRVDGVLVEDIYDLMMVMIESFSNRIASASVEVTSMYNKRLMVHRYLLRDLTEGIFRMLFEIQKRERNGLTLKDIKDAFKRHLPKHTCTKINRKHAEVTSVSSSSDCMLFKITGHLVLQNSTSSNGSSHSKGIIFKDADALHVSVSEVGSYLNLPKSEPTGRSRLNLFVRVEPDGRIIRDAKLAELTDRVQREIQR